MRSTLVKMVVAIVVIAALPTRVAGAPVNYATYLDVNGVHAGQALFYETLTVDPSVFATSDALLDFMFLNGRTPEPASVILMGTGLAANAARRRRRGRAGRRGAQAR